MRTVTDRIDGPSRFIIADDAGAARYAAQIAMGWRRAGIDNRDFHAGTIIARGQAIKTHRPLTPAQQLPAREVAQRRTERSHDNPVDTIGNELRTIEPESPVVDLRFDEDRPDGIRPFALNAQRDTAVGVGDTLGRPHAAEHIDFGVRQRAGLAQHLERRREAVSQRREYPGIGHLRCGRVEHVAQALIALHRKTCSCLGLQQLGLVGSHAGEHQRTEWRLSKFCALKSEQPRRLNRIHHLDVRTVGELLDHEIGTKGRNSALLLRRDHELRRARCDRCRFP